MMGKGCVCSPLNEIETEIVIVFMCSLFLMGNFYRRSEVDQCTEN